MSHQHFTRGPPSIGNGNGNGNGNGAGASMSMSASLSPNGLHRGMSQQSHEMVSPLHALLLEQRADV
jgi:hypothetical protein